MKTIIIKTQAELDALPDKFDEYTVIEIRSDPGTWIQVLKARESSSVEAWESSSVEAWGSSSVEARESSRVVARESSRVEAWGSSSVEAWESSSVEAWDSSRVVARDSSRVVARDSSSVEARDSSRVEAFQFAVIIAFSFAALALHDRVVVRQMRANLRYEVFGAEVTQLEDFAAKEIPFETWLERGYVVADGITSKLVSKKKVGDIEVFTVRQSILDDKDYYVVKRAETFSHGETVEKAIEGLRYKLSDRDTSRFEGWRLDREITLDDAVQAYRTITGACEFGTRRFVEGVQVPAVLTVKKAIEMTAGQFGSEAFAGFFGHE